jgi:hypothetical protein
MTVNDVHRHDKRSRRVEVLLKGPNQAGIVGHPGFSRRPATQGVMRKARGCASLCRLRACWRTPEYSARPTVSATSRRLRPPVGLPPCRVLRRPALILGDLALLLSHRAALHPTARAPRPRRTACLASSPGLTIWRGCGGVGTHSYSIRIQTSARIALKTPPLRSNNI